MRILGRSVVVGTTAVALALAGCSQDTDTTIATTTTSGSVAAQATPGKECVADDIGVTGGFGQAPSITIPDTCAPPTTLITKDLVEGNGPAAAVGSALTMNYSLVTWSDKQKLDSSFDRGQTFPVVLGQGRVIQGWDQGLVGIKQGTRRLLIVPPALGYGSGGQGVKPNETLVFVTDAVAVGH